MIATAPIQTWTLQPIVSPTILAIVAALLLLLLFWGPGFTTITWRRRLSLTLLRLGVILLALIATLRPGCVQQVERSQSSVLIFLIDTSRSMELPHRSDDSTRFGAIKQILEDNRALINQLQENRIAVRFFGFDSRVTELNYENGVDLPAKPTGSETDIGSSIFETAISARNQRLLGIVVLSDGVQNALDPQVELSQAADALNSMAVPLYAVPMGLPGNTGQMADVAVISLPEQHRIAVKNQLTVETTVSAQGYANQPVTVQLFVTDSVGNEQLADTIQFVPDKSYVEEKHRLRHIPTEPGQFRMRVLATPVGNELATRNNELPSFLNVYDGGLRVLYLIGNPSWEQSFLRRAIATASQGVELIPITIYSDEASRRKWPLGGEITQWFKDPTIDVFIIGDVDASALYDPQTQTENLDLLAAAVDRGKGLIMLGGAHSFGPGGYHSTPLDDILPIKMNLDERQDFPPAALRTDLHINHPVRLEPVKDHFVTRLGSDDDFRVAWQSLPPLTGANRFSGVKDAAEILLRGDAGNPILVSARLGGRVLAFAGDSTWRWVMHGHETEFKQFWRQILLWLAFQDGRENNSVWIDLPQRRFQPNSFISFHCRASDSTGSLIADADFEAILMSPDQTISPLTIDRSNQRGEIDRERLSQPGIYQIQLKGFKDQESLGESSFEFVVFDRDREKAVAAADPEQMARLAARTQAHGGQVVLPENLTEFLGRLKANPPESIQVPLKWQLGQTARDGMIFLLLFTALLTAEWTLRKKWGLV